MTKKIIFTADEETPSPSIDWTENTEEKKINILNEAVIGKMEFTEQIDFLYAKNDGQIIIRLKKQLSASQRGTVLLNLEEFLKKKIDVGLTVWVEALGDKNSLRNLRGIEVKHD